MIHKFVALISLLTLSIIANPAFAQTCTSGASGVPPTASITFVAPTINTDSTPVVAPLTYNVYQSSASGAEVKVASALKGSPITVTTGLTPKTTVYLKISVTDANGNEGALSNEVCKTFPASVPGSVTITIS